MRLGASTSSQKVRFSVTSRHGDRQIVADPPRPLILPFIAEKKVKGIQERRKGTSSALNGTGSTLNVAPGLVTSDAHKVISDDQLMKVHPRTRIQPSVSRALS